MAPIVRGNKLLVVDTPPSCIAQRSVTKDKFGFYSYPQVGDKLWVASRKKNGWLRVKNTRTDLVTSLRVGNWLEKVSADWGNKPVTKPVAGLATLAAAALVVEDPKVAAPLQCVPPPSSSMDQLIRKSQVDALEAALLEKDKQIADLEYVGRRDAEAYHERVHELEALVAEQAERLAQDVELDNEMRRRDTMWREKLAAAEALIASQQAVMQTDDEVIREKNEKIERLEDVVDQIAHLGTSGSCCGGHEEDFVAVGLPVEPLPPTRTQSAA